jgi:serine/threonine protein kinase
MLILCPTTAPSMSKTRSGCVSVHAFLLLRGLVPFLTSAPVPQILMEYCALGSLRDMIDMCRPLTGTQLFIREANNYSRDWFAYHAPCAFPTESEVAVVCFHTLKALIYLHSRNIIHRDVKAANILLNDQAQVKIGMMDP